MLSTISLWNIISKWIDIFLVGIIPLHSNFDDHIIFFFYKKPKFGFIFAIIGSISAIQWLPHLISSEGIETISLFNIGYYLWTICIMLMSVHLFKDITLKIIKKFFPYHRKLMS